MAVDVPGLVVVIALYLVVLIFGVFAAFWFNKHKLQDASEEEKAMVAGRKIGGVIGTFTITATLCGGGFLNGTAEGIVTDGLAWTIFPLAMSLGFALGGLIYAKPMRERCYLTMLDPLQEKYTSGMVSIIFIGSLMGDIFWSASIFGALGTSLSVIIDLDVEATIWISAAVAVIYTGFGKLVSLALTDIVQLLFMILGMFLCLPFAMSHEHVPDISTTFDLWGGSIEDDFIATWIDLTIAMILWSIPWQTYFQWVLAMKSTKQAQVLSLMGALGALLFTIPPLLIGAVGASATLAALCAAVMSSIDSAVLSSSTLFTHNVYKMGLRHYALAKELQIVQTISVNAAGILSALIAIYVKTIFGLFVMAGDIVYVIVFPQLTAAVFCNWVNGYGSFFGFALGLILRIGAGEPYLNFEPIIKYPYFDEELGQRFPFRFLCMACNLIGIFAFSYIFKFIFEKGYLPLKCDFLKCTSVVALEPQKEKMTSEDHECEEIFTHGFANQASGPQNGCVVTLKMIKL